MVNAQTVCEKQLYTALGFGARLNAILCAQHQLTGCQGTGGSAYTFGP
jgi:hypothetical protein